MATYEADVTFVPIATLDNSSGRLHIRVSERHRGVAHRILTDERCQADQSGNFAVVATGAAIDAVLESGAENLQDRCEFCFPR